MNHTDCIPKEEVKLQEDELARLNEKVKILMQNNSCLNQQLEQNSIDKKNLQAKLGTSQEYLNAIIEEVKTIAHKICENRKDDGEEKVKPLDYWLRDMEVTSDIKNVLKEGIKLINANIVELHSHKELLTRTNMILEILKKQNCEYKAELALNKSTLNELLQVQSNSQNQQDKLKKLLKVMKEKQICLQNEIEILKNAGTIEDFQEDFVVIFNVLQDYIDSWDGNVKFMDILTKLPNDKNLLSCINLIFNANTQKVLFGVFNKIKIKLSTSNENFNNSILISKSLNSHVEYLESETLLLNAKVKEMRQHIQGNILARIDHFEILTNNKKASLKEPVLSLDLINETNSPPIYENSKVENRYTNLDQTISNTDKGDDIYREGSELKEQLFEKCICTCNKELESLKTLIATEITSMNDKEDKKSLVCNSSNEISNKLMKNIIKKQKEVQHNTEQQSIIDFQELYVKLNESNNKINSQVSWIKKLEEENEQLTNDLDKARKTISDLNSRSKILAEDLTCKNNQLHYFENKNSELILNNKKLNSEILDLTEKVNSRNKSVKNLQKEANDLNKEIQMNTDLVVDLRNKSSFPEKRLLNFMNRISNKEGSTQNTHGVKCHNLENSTSECCCLSLSTDNLIEYDLDYFQNEKFSHVQTCLIGQLHKEILLLKEIFNCNLNNIEHSEQLSSCSDKFNVLKDTVKLFTNKLLEIETCQISSLSQFQKFIECKTKKFCDFEKCIRKIYEILPFDNESETKDKCMVENISISGDLNILKLELEQTKEECLSFADESENFQNHANSFHSLLQILANKFKTIENDILKTVELVENLQKSIEIEKSKKNKLKTQLKTKSKQIHSLKENNSCLEKKIEDLQLQSSNILKSLSRMDCNIALNYNDANSKIEFVDKFLKHYSDNKCLVSSLSSEMEFFSNQCDLMKSYIETIERSFMLAMEDKRIELITLTCQLQTANQQLNEANVFYNNLISKLPLKITNSNHAFEVIDKILSDYSIFKNIEGYSKEIEIRDRKLSTLLEEQKHLLGLNSSLKIELTKCEDSIRNQRSIIRNLRSELQTVRLQHQKEGNE